jgi:hypothetical protein
MNPFSSETLRLILIFFVPGFISIKIYDLYVPSERRDFSKSLLEAVSFSCINFALLYWPIVTIHSNGFQNNHPAYYYLLALVMLFISPIFWPIIFSKITNLTFFRNKLIDPILKPWDRLFSQRKSFWVIVHLNDGRLIGGKYGQNSFTSTYPADEQIFFEEVWKLDHNGKFLEKIEHSHGIIISKDNFQLIEFFR